MHNIQIIFWRLVRYLLPIVFVTFEWGVGAIVITYVSRWLGLSTTVARVLSTLWLLIVAGRWAARGAHKKKFSGEDAMQAAIKEAVRKDRQNDSRQ
jgi:hypothetical protein